MKLKVVLLQQETLDQARLICSSWARCCPQHSVLEPTATLEIRKCPLNLYLTASRQNVEHFHRFLVSYEKRLTTISHVHK